MPHDLQTLWKALVDLWNTGKPELAAEVYAPSAVHHQPGNDPVHGPKEIAQFIAVLHTAFPNFKMEITRTLIDANEFVHGWTCTGTHKGQYMGVPPSGRRVEVHGLTIGRISHGRIQEETVYFDRLELLQQMGAVPAPARELAGAAR